MFKHKTYRFRLYPNKAQKQFFNKTMGCSRYVFNHFLNYWKETYKSTGKSISRYTCSSHLTQLKHEEATLWLKDADSIALQASLEHLWDGIERFFKKQNNFPRFKNKKHSVQSYTTKYTSNNIQINKNNLRLPKIGWVRFAKSREVVGKIKRATIRRNPSGKYFVTILCAVDIAPCIKTGSSIGIDLGLQHYATLSTTEKIENPRLTIAMENKLTREQRKLSRRYEKAKKEGKDLLDARNYQKQRIKVARLKEKVKNQREDFLNKLSTDLIKNHDVICIEKLNIQKMQKNRHLAKSIADVSWSLFISKLKYKADWYGKKIVQLDPWFPSSQLCSSCRSNEGKKPLYIREWTCQSCGAQHDRDINASLNIWQNGMEVFLNT